MIDETWVTKYFKTPTKEPKLFKILCYPCLSHKSFDQKYVNKVGDQIKCHNNNRDPKYNK